MSDGIPQVARRRVAREMAVWFVAVTVATSVLLEAGWFAVGDQRPMWRREVSYSVDIMRIGTTNFTVLVPTLVLPDGTAADLFHAKTGRTGAVTDARVVNTEHGPALSISGSGDVRFWAVGSPPSTASEPSSYIVRYPGANVDLGLWAPDPQGWVPKHQDAFQASLGHAWLNVEGGAASGRARIVVWVGYPVDCASHDLVFDANRTAGWGIAEVEAQRGCPVA